jgi:hypothetical protein
MREAGQNILPTSVSDVGGDKALSLCMIVRDNARTLRAALESIRPYVDEMIVVDTGSVDENARDREVTRGQSLSLSVVR